MVDERISRAIDNDHTAAMKITSDGKKLIRKKNGSSFTSSSSISICTICKKSFKNHLIYRKHLKIHADKSFVCQVCNKSFVHKHYLQSHMLVHGKNQNYQCHICHKRFGQKGNLNQHMKFHSSKKPFKCEICSKDFFQQEHLKAHVRHHNNERPFQCETCNKSFNIKSSLQRHMNCHTGAKPFICDICNRGYTRRSVLMLHIQQVHENKKPFQCSECQLCFSQKGNLQAHFRRKHLQPKTENKKGKERGKRIMKKQNRQNSKAWRNLSKDFASTSEIFDSCARTKWLKSSGDGSSLISNGKIGSKIHINNTVPFRIIDSSLHDNILTTDDPSTSEITDLSEDADSNCETVDSSNVAAIEDNELYTLLGKEDNALCDTNGTDCTESILSTDVPQPSTLGTDIDVHDDIKSLNQFDMLLEDAKGWEDYLLADSDILEPAIPPYDMGELLYSPVKVNAMLSKNSDLGDLFPNLALSFGHDYACTSSLFSPDDLEDINDVPSTGNKSTLVQTPKSVKKRKRNLQTSHIKISRNQSHSKAIKCNLYDNVHLPTALSQSM